jgi:hypothetical protein
MNYLQLKSQLNNKKGTFAKRISVYSDGHEYGKYYGYTLAEPFTEEEVNKVCQEKGIQLPQELYDYLTKISSELFNSSYPVKFNLSKIPTSIILSKVNFSKNVGYLSEDDFYNESDNSLDQDSKLESNDFYNCLVKVGDNGCVFDDMLYIENGTQYGTVWQYQDDDNWLKVSNNIKEYILKI